MSGAFDCDDVWSFDECKSPPIRRDTHLREIVRAVDLCSQWKFHLSPSHHRKVRAAWHPICRNDLVEDLARATAIDCYARECACFRRREQLHRTMAAAEKREFTFT